MNDATTELTPEASKAFWLETITPAERRELFLGKLVGGQRVELAVGHPRHDVRQVRQPRIGRKLHLDAPPALEEGVLVEALDQPPAVDEGDAIGNAFHVHRVVG